MALGTLLEQGGHRGRVQRRHMKAEMQLFPFQKNKSGSGLESSFSFLNSGLGQQRSLYKKDHRRVSHSKSCCELQAYLVSKVENLLLSEMFVTETMNCDYSTFNHYRNRKWETRGKILNNRLKTIICTCLLSLGFFWCPSFPLWILKLISLMCGTGGTQWLLSILSPLLWEEYDVGDFFFLPPCEWA